MPAIPDTLATEGLATLIRAFIGQTTTLPVFSTEATGGGFTEKPVDGDTLQKAVAMLINKTRRHPISPGMILPFDADTLSLLTGLTTAADQLAAVKAHAVTMDGGVATAVTTTAGPFWLLCDGTTQHGVATPAYIGRVPMGVITAISGDGRTLIARQALGAGKHALVAGELAAHTHALGTGGRSVWTSLGITQEAGEEDDGSYSFAPFPEAITATESTGSGTAHENLPPVIGAFFLIRTPRVYYWT